MTSTTENMNFKRENTKTLETASENAENTEKDRTTCLKPEGNA